MDSDKFSYETKVNAIESKIKKHLKNNKRPANIKKTICGVKSIEVFFQTLVSPEMISIFTIFIIVIALLYFC